jgi:hypothetical protein
MTTENAQWVKPLSPSDIPANTAPIWNSTTSNWEFTSIELTIAENTANTANT